MSDICGSCKWHKKQGEDWVCMNENSDCYTFETEYGWACEDWEEKDV